MVTDNHYRWDFIGLSTDIKPTPATSPKVVDGSTFYCSDNSKLYVYCKTQWYEKTATGGGGTSDFEDLENRPKYNGTAMTGETDIPTVPTVVQTTGESLTDVMSQKAVTDALSSAGGIKVLTTSDYNANSSDWSDTDPTHFNAIAVWKLDEGMYRMDLSNSSYTVADNTYFDSVNRTLDQAQRRLVIYFCVVDETASAKKQIYIYLNSINQDLPVWINSVRTADGLRIGIKILLSTSAVANNLTTRAVDKPLSAEQGYQIKLLIDALDQRITALGG